MAKPCFPGAQGYGTTTPGGSGGQILRVTTLADDSPVPPPGSWRAAIRTPGPRRIYFDVEGEINLVRHVSIIDPFFTVHGESAPGEGVIITGDETRFGTHDGVITGLRFRVGTNHMPDGGWDNGDAVNWGDATDTDSSKVYNIVLHGNTLMMATDELCTVWWGAHDITVSYNILAWQLYRSFHPKTTGPPFEGHSMCHLFGSGIIGGEQKRSRRVSSHHNLLAFCDQRNPQVSEADQIDIRGNVIWGHGIEAFALEKGGGAPTGLKRVNAYRNAWFAGPTFTGRTYCRVANDVGDSIRLYIAENFGMVDGKMITDPKHDNWLAVRDFGGHQLPEEVGPTRYRLDQPFPCPRVCVLPTALNVPHVLANAGAGPRLPDGSKRRDGIDRRLIQDIHDGTGHIIDSPSEVLPLN